MIHVCAEHFQPNSENVIISQRCMSANLVIFCRFVISNAVLTKSTSWYPTNYRGDVQMLSAGILYCRLFRVVTWGNYILPMETNTSLRPEHEREGGECRDTVQMDTSNVTYPPQSFKTVTSEEAAGKISLTSAVIAMALIGNCLLGRTPTSLESLCTMSVLSPSPCYCSCSCCKLV